jgi:acyl dehydratase
LPVPVLPIDEARQLVGGEIGKSDWVLIDQDRISSFADATLDHQWIHVDQEAAASGPFGATIAHGFLTLSLLSYLMSGISVQIAGAVMAINYGSDKVRFLAPVPVGSRIRAVSTLTDLSERGTGRYLTSQHVVVEIDGNETPALVADVLTMYVLAP